MFCHPLCSGLDHNLSHHYHPKSLLQILRILSSSLLFPSASCLPPVALGRNQPLKRERPKWKSDYPMTEGQLRSKRDEFWDTAPAFEGRKEIWDALRAAASAFESNDHLLAQAILDGASITLPHGNFVVGFYAIRGFYFWVLIHRVCATVLLTSSALPIADDFLNSGRRPVCVQSGSSG